MKAARTRALNRKHAGTSKHSSTSKHTGSATRHAAKVHKQVARRAAATVKAAHLRAWSPDSDVALCSARAVAQSLQIALGRSVSDEDVLALHWAAGGDRDAGASIWAVLEAAQQTWGGTAGQDLNLQAMPLSAVPGIPRRHSSLILGVDWPEPHAVVAHNGLWWSWGERYEPWTDQISEAWAVTW